MERLKKWTRFLGSTIVALIVLLMQISYGMAAPIELSLSDSIVMALKNSSIEKITQADKEVSRFNLIEAKARFGPSITYIHTDKLTNHNFMGLPASSWKHVTNDFHVESPSNPISYTSDNDLLLYLPVYTSGSLESQVKQANINDQISDMEVNRVRQQVKVDTIIAYLNVLQYQNLLTVKQNSVHNLKEHMNSVQIQYDAGAVDKSHILRAEVELGNAQQDFVKAQHNCDVAIIKLKKVLGLPQISQIRLKDQLEYEEFSRSAESCLQVAMEHRLDLKQSQACVESAEEGIKLAKSQSLPQVSLNGDIDLNDYLFPGLKNGNWSIGLVVSMNVFDSGVTKAKVKTSEIGLFKAKEKVVQATEAIAAEVSEAYSNLLEAEKRVKMSQNLVGKAEECYKIAGIRYKEGAGTYLEVIDAQLSLSQAQSNYVQALYDYNISKVALNKSMGTL